MFTNTGTTPRNVTVRLTATDTNSDAVGPESATEDHGHHRPAPSRRRRAAAARRPPRLRTRPPTVVRLTLAKRLTVATKLRLTFTTDESSSVSARAEGGQQDRQGEQGLHRGRQAHAHVEALEGGPASCFVTGAR